MGSFFASIVQGAVAGLLAPFVAIYNSWKDRQQGRKDQIADEQTVEVKAEDNALKAATDTTSASVDDQLRSGTA